MNGGSGEIVLVGVFLAGAFYFVGIKALDMIRGLFSGQKKAKEPIAAAV